MAPATLGERLQQLRGEANLSLETLAEKTKIQRKYLERLEGGAYDSLPAPVYVRGFLRKVSAALAVDEEDILLHYQRESGALSAVSSGNDIYRGVRPLSSPFALTPKHIFVVVISVAFLLVAGYFAYHFLFFANAPQVKIIEPKEQDTIVSEESIKIIGTAENVAYLTVNGEEGKVREDKGFEHIVELKDGINTIVVQAHGSNGRVVETVRKIIKVE